MYTLFRPQFALEKGGRTVSGSQQYDAKTMESISLVYDFHPGQTYAVKVPVIAHVDAPKYSRIPLEGRLHRSIVSMQASLAYPRRDPPPPLVPPSLSRVAAAIRLLDSFDSSIDMACLAHLLANSNCFRYPLMAVAQ